MNSDFNLAEYLSDGIESMMLFEQAEEVKKLCNYIN